MMFPLAVDFGHQANLVLGTVIGVAFGFALERGGFGQAPILAAQFYGSDMRVLKVMFSAIVTALLGMTVLSGVGLLDMSQVTVPETFLGPQIFGGLLLGVGFIVSGYCPGTSWVSMASGNWDGLVTILGVIAGSLVFGLAYPLVGDFYTSGAMGVVRLPDFLGVPQALVAAAVVAMAVGAFLFGEWVERALGRSRGEAPPTSEPATRNRVFAGFGVVALVGIATLALPAAPVPVVPERTVASMDAVALAKALIERPGAVQIVDLRPTAECAVKRIPGAICRPADDAEGAFLADLPRTRMLVLYGAGDVAPPEGVRRFKGDVAVLAGGFPAFESGILAVAAAPADATPAVLADWRLRSALGAYFSGTKVQAPPPASVPAVRPASPVRDDAPVKKGGGC
jgi:rhodanese-related sulfurtransferase